MKLIKILLQCAVNVELKQNSMFNYDVDKQKKYIKHFKEPIDDIERSFNQYKCQMKLSGNVISVLLNIISFLLIIIFLIKYRKCNIKKAKSESDAVFFPDGKPKNILPNDIIFKYQKIINENSEGGHCLKNKDIKFLIELFLRHPLSLYFIFKCMMKIAKYSFAFEMYSPKVIIVCAEYSFTSSVLTSYCKMHDIKHINVMHGEKLFYMRDSYFRFHECYIWDDYYKNLFVQLKADPKQFIVSVPRSIKSDCDSSIRRLYEYTYYLASEQENELIVINNSLKKLADRGYKVAVRPHPRYSDLKLVNKFFLEYDIEDSTIPIEESILRTKNAVSLYSTVLNQAYHNGVSIVIDDLTNPEKYNKLFELQYVFLHKKHKLLSQELK